MNLMAVSGLIYMVQNVSDVILSSFSSVCSEAVISNDVNIEEQNASAVLNIPLMIIFLIMLIAQVPTV